MKMHKGEKIYLSAMAVMAVAFVGLVLYVSSKPSRMAVCGGRDNLVLPIVFFDETQPQGQRVITFDDERWSDAFCSWNSGEGWSSQEMNEILSDEILEKTELLRRKEGCR